LKIAHNMAHLEVAMTGEERAALTTDRCNYTLSRESAQRWLVLVSDENGQHKIGARLSDSTHPYSVVIAGLKDLPLFGAETVQPTMNAGRLFIPRPFMNIVRRSSQSRSGKPPLASDMPGLTELKQAVQIINNMRRQYGDQLEMSVTNGELRVRLLVEI
jgi:hypothetical protein